ncbi:transcription factor HES-5-like [Polymixia lowei]
MKPGEIRFSQQRPLQHRDPDMTPTITSAMTYSEEHLTLTHKLRKPQVEKLRRERINSSIEQLKSLLGPEILKQQPDSKMEKADILEMTVCLLRQLQCQSDNSSCCSAPINRGYSKCVQEVVHLLSEDEVKTQSKSKLLNHIQNPPSSSDITESEQPQLISPVQPSITKEEAKVNSALWRPW